MSRSKLYFVTDAHLGAGSNTLEREHELCAFLDQIKTDADMIFFLGDIFDFWFTYKYVVPRGYVRLLGKMAELADSGIKIHFFAGNHDMWMFDYLQKEIGCIMHDEPTLIEYDGQRFLLGHGDGLGHLDHKYDFLRHVFRSRVNQRLFALVNPGLTFGIAQGWSRRSRKGHLKKNPQIFEYQGDNREGIVLYIKQRMAEEQFDYCLFGHRHTPLVRTIETSSTQHTTYVNVGDWLMHRNYAVYADGKVELKEFRPAPCGQ